MPFKHSGDCLAPCRGSLYNSLDMYCEQCYHCEACRLATRSIIAVDGSPFEQQRTLSGQLHKIHFTARIFGQCFHLYIQSVRLFNRDVRLFLVSSTLFGFAIFGGIYPILLNLYLLRLGYGPEFIGLLNASGSLCIAIFCIPAGALGSRWGSRQVMIAGLLLLVAGNGLLPLAEFAPAGSRSTWLLATNLLGALGVALYIVNTSPYLMAVTGDAERNHAFSVQAALGTLAAFFGSLAGGFLPELIATVTHTSLSQPAPYRYPLLFAAAMLLPAAAALLSMADVREVRTATGGGKAGPAPLFLIGMLTLVVTLQVAGEGAARTFFNVYMDAGLGVATAQIGLAAALAQLLAAPAALMAPLLMARWGSVRTFTLATFGMAASLLPLISSQPGEQPASASSA